MTEEEVTEGDVADEEETVGQANGNKTEGESKPRKGLGIDFGRQKDINKLPGSMLNFDAHMVDLDHTTCDIDDYPDLSLPRDMRLKLK